MLLIALLIGCGGEGAATADGRKEVRVYLLLISTKQVEFYQWAEQTYEEAHPDTDIIIEQFPGSSLKDFEIKLRLRFSSGQAPDVFGAPEAVAAEYARLGLLEPAPDYIERIVQEKALNAMARTAPYIDGTCYGVTNASVWQALYYNKDMFREAGLDPEAPPATWDEMVSMGKQLTKDGTWGIMIPSTGYPYWM
ncbi:MAG TPA: extracellular solute-binding protein, partial [Rhodothermales bacterium]|nr:extracellular solute-binding protein [Rhodothermales bacterium]